MLKKSTSFLLDIREAYLVKRRSFLDSFGRFTFYVSPMPRLAFFSILLEEGS
jgi:hypothetical protein